MSRKYNFCAGPSALPTDVLNDLKEEILDFQQMIDLVKNFDQDLAESLQLRFDESMSQFKLDEKDD